MNDGSDGTGDSSGDARDGASGRDGGASDERVDSDDEWRFTLEDIEEREANAEAAAEAERRRAEPIEPGNPSLENTAFVLLGVVLALFILSRLVV